MTDFSINGYLRTHPLLRLIKDALGHWSDHDASRIGAALSYYTVFSLGPLAVLLIALASLFADRSLAELALLGQVGNVVGPAGRDFILSLLESSAHPATGIIAAVAGFAALLLGATGVFSELKNAMDDFWNTPTAKRKDGALGFIKTHLLTFSIIPALVFLLLVSLVFSSMLNFFAREFSNIADATFLFNIFDILFNLAIVTFLFAFIYRYLPSRRLPWKETLLGASITSILFSIGKVIISFYLAKTASVAAFGPASALVLIMIWTYYSIQIFFIGASITYVYSKKYGHLSKDA